MYLSIKLKKLTFSPLCKYSSLIGMSLLILLESEGFRYLGVLCDSIGPFDEQAVTNTDCILSFCLVSTANETCS